MNTHAYTPQLSDKIAENVFRTPLEGLYFIPHQAHEDTRGFYAELSHIPEIEEIIGTSFGIKQMNLSHSKQHVIRGFHAENWNKLLSVVTGVAFCAWADIRPTSPTFGQVVTMTMGVGEGAAFGSMFVSRGIANSFCVTTGPLNYVYAVDELYTQRDTSGDMALSLFDEQLAVPWPISREQMIVSERDQQALSLTQLFPNNKTSS